MNYKTINKQKKALYTNGEFSEIHGAEAGKFASLAKIVDRTTVVEPRRARMAKSGNQLSETRSSKEGEI